MHTFISTFFIIFWPAWITVSYDQSPFFEECRNVFTNVDISDVKNKYEHSFNNISYLFLPAKNAKRLIVSFNGLVANRYFYGHGFGEKMKSGKISHFCF